MDREGPCESTLCVSCVSAGRHVKVTGVAGVPASEGTTPTADSDTCPTDLWSGFIIVIYDEPGLSLARPGFPGVCECVCLGTATGGSVSRLQPVVSPALRFALQIQRGI